MSRGFRSLLGLFGLAVLAAGGAALLHNGKYGLTIFVLFPMVLGGLAAWVFRPATAGKAALCGAQATGVALAAFLLLGMEGLLCVLMAAPLAVPLGALGGWLVYQAAPSRVASGGLAALLLLSPVSVVCDVHARPTVFAVRTTMDIAAPPARVWSHVISFSDLTEPPEWYFRGGLAYPLRARIAGSGPGAVRYCEFSTGPFVEPIEVWDEPRLLRFRVTENPAPMHEWSPYAHVLPKHLHGYLVSRQGQFRLTPLPNGHTLLGGTTWYQHGLWPEQYWRWWSDAIIHRIHLRVMRHIRSLAEADRADGLAGAQPW